VNLKSDLVAVIGSGTMGRGIAQLAAAAGHGVLLFDSLPGAAERGKAAVVSDLGRLVARGRLDEGEAAAIAGRIEVCDALESLKPSALVIEAIYENLEAKRALFGELETIVAPDAILATNTSSLSVTAIAAKLERPGRFAGMHFFNPAPVMKLVEIVSGLASARGTLDRLHAIARDWGKTPVDARSTPGFIVNRVARPYYAEALRLLEEQVADPATLDALMTEAGGFRMGPFALMDLIGHDVNYAVSRSVFDAYYGDPRFRPSITQLEMVDAGWLGRKTGRGFYDYRDGAARPTPRACQVKPDAVPFASRSIFDGDFVEDGVLFSLTDGRTARDRAREAAMPVILLDHAGDFDAATRIGFTACDAVPDGVVARFVVTATGLGKAATRLPDWPGLVVMRTVAMLANEAWETVLQGVADKAGVDTAMRLGVNYPLGPIEWGERIGLSHVERVLDAIFDATRDPRYRTSFGLRRAAARLSPVPKLPSWHKALRVEAGFQAADDFL